MRGCRGWARVKYALVAVGLLGAVSLLGATPTALGTASPSSLQLDSTPPGGRVTFPGWTDVISVVTADDGSFLVELERRDTSGVRVAFGVARLRSDATLNTSFGASGPTPGIVEIDLSAYNFGLQAILPPVLPLSDGRFFVGPRLYRSDGSVDTGYGSNGFLTPGVGAWGNTAFAMFRTSTDQVVEVSSIFGAGCAFLLPDANGVAVQWSDLGVGCDQAVPIRLADGDTLLVVRDVWNFRLIFVRPDGTLDTSHGAGTGVVTTGTGELNLRAAQLGPDGYLVILGSSTSGAGNVYRVGLDGVSAPSFGQFGTALINGDVGGLSLDSESRILISVPYTFALGHPKHPAFVRLTTDGHLDQSFNASGLVAGWIDSIGLGVQQAAMTTGHTVTSDGRLLLPFNDYGDGTTRADAALLVLAPVPAPLPPPPPPQPGIAVAAATQQAVRLRLAGG